MQMISPESIDVASLPFLTLADRKRLPNCAACYFVLEGAKILYIGQSNSLIVRWLNHNKLKQFSSRGTEIKIAWLAVSP